MNHWHIARTNDNNSTIRTWSNGEPLRWRVDLVNSATGARATIEEHERREDADELADWFGRTGTLHAEVSRIELPPPVNQAAA